MKRFQLAGTAVAVAIAWVTGAAAQSTPATYVEADVGAVFGGTFEANGNDVLLGPVAFNEKLRTGWTAGLLAGRRLGGGPLSVEAEGLYLNDAIGSDDLNAALGVSAGLRTQTYAGLANVKLEEPIALGAGGLHVAPYVAGGVGYGHNSISILGDHYDGGGLVWQGKAGLAFQVSRELTWDVGYRYVRLPTFDTNKLGLSAHMKTDAQVVSVGLRYSFGAP